MRQRFGFALSLLAACGIHAIVLFVPRAAFVENVRVPTVEILLTNVTAPQGPAAPVAKVVTRPIAAPAPALAEAPPQPAAEAPGPAADPPGTEPHPEADTPVSATSPAVDTVGVSSGAEGAEAQSPAGGASSAAAYSPAGAARDGAAGVSSPAAPAFIPPRPVSEVLPRYPLSARRSGFEGVVKVGVMVDERGAVTDVEVLSSSGHALLDQAVLDALRHARFAPARQDGNPVPGRVVIPVRFRLSSVAH